ncbi:MAG: phosphoglycerate dehydrogenase [Cyclobacteriaceae bacterium]|nr:phosphoglycerate dehydrogenase [Cyclobacteriaceae bacterium]
MKKILIVDKMHTSIVGMLAQIGYEADYRPDIRKEEIHQVIRHYSGLIVRSKISVNKELIARAANLRFIGRAGAGVDQVDLEALAEWGIRLINAPEGNRDALAEHTMGMLLALLNKLHQADREVRGMKWDREGNRGYELMGKTVGIFGYGFMGAAFARRLSGFGCKILAFDKFKTDFTQDKVEECPLDVFKKEVQILSLHVPLTPETRGYFDYAFLSSFPNLMFLINTARGEILPLKDLNRLLDEKKIIGACLDVLENEKINQLAGTEKEQFDRLIKRKEVIFSPHVGGWTFESYEKINEVLVEKIAGLGI